MKGTITLIVDKSTTQSDLRAIRERYKQDDRYKNYKINIIVSGYGNMKEQLNRFIMARVKT